MGKLQLIGLFSLFIGSVIAATSVTTQNSNLAKTVTLSSSMPVVQQQVSPNLTAIDNNANDLIRLKQRIEVEKAYAEIKKLQGNKSENNKANGTNMQTVVTGVAINSDGRKIAWLQFADGGSLTVNIGSRVGRYVVSDITMTGVKLSLLSNKRHSISTSIFLSRVYYIPEDSLRQTSTNSSKVFMPSPVVTDANTRDNDTSSQVVPPIIQ